MSWRWNARASCHDDRFSVFGLNTSMTVPQTNQSINEGISSWLFHYMFTRPWFHADLAGIGGLPAILQLVKTVTLHQGKRSNINTYSGQPVSLIHESISISVQIKFDLVPQLKHAAVSDVLDSLNLFLTNVIFLIFFSIVFMNEFKELQVKPGEQTVIPGCGKFWTLKICPCDLIIFIVSR